MKPPPKHCYKCEGDIVAFCRMCGRPFCRSHGDVTNMMCGPHYWMFAVIYGGIAVVVLAVLWWFYG